MFQVDRHRIDIEFSGDIQNVILEFESFAIVCRVAGAVPGGAPDPNPDLRRDTTGRSGRIAAIFRTGAGKVSGSAP